MQEPIGSLDLQKPPAKRKAATLIHVPVFQRCKDKLLVCLIVAGDLYSHATESFVKDEGAMAGVGRGQQGKRGSAGNSGLRPSNAACSFNFIW